MNPSAAGASPVDPEDDDGRRGSGRWRASGSDVVGRAAHLFSVQALLIVTLLIVVIFAILLPDTYLTPLTARAIIYGKSTVALLAMGEMIVIASGNFDLSVGYGVGATYILSIVLQVQQRLPWELAVAIAMFAGLLI